MILTSHPFFIFVTLTKYFHLFLPQIYIQMYIHVCIMKTIKRGYKFGGDLGEWYIGGSGEKKGKGG